jgi:superoxide dismutase, Fe-Mn family
MFELTPLPYATDALAPAISRRVLELHHGKHHAAYVKKTNELLSKSEIKADTLEDVIAQARGAHQTLFNNAAQAWNHGFYWRCMTPGGAAPAEEIAHAITRSFGGMDAFRSEFLERGQSHFASGWIWLVSDAAGALSFWEGHDAETPVARNIGAPVLVCDVWEHAYYLDRENQRAPYLEAWFDIIDWRFASEQWRAARGEGEGWRY